MFKEIEGVLLGQPRKLHLSDRYFEFNRQFSVRDVFDGLVELITNSDDSYHRQYLKGLRDVDGGPILIEYRVQRAKPSLMRILDHAEGMTLDEMWSKLGTVGNRQSGEGDRGFMARGAKDCTELGPMVIESIKDGFYYKCELTTEVEIIPWIDGDEAEDTIRKKLGIPNGNGTVVTLQIHPRHKMPRVSRIVRDLPWHFALRGILSEDSPTQVHIKNLNEPSSQPHACVYRHPEAPVILEEEFDVPGYPDAACHLIVWRNPEPFEPVSDRRFRRSGVLIKGSRAIHECSFLTPGLEKDPHTAHYFGILECSYIDRLLDEYDQSRDQGLLNLEHNPNLIIDPNRRHGIIRDHPFTRALFQIPIEKLRASITQDREMDRSDQSEISNKETKLRLGRLAKLASRFIKQHSGTSPVLSSGEEVDTRAFNERGIMIAPTYVNLAKGEKKALKVYVKKELLGVETFEAEVHVETGALDVLDPVFNLSTHSTMDDRLVGRFRIQGKQLAEAVYLQVKVGDLPPGEVIVHVIDRRNGKRKFKKNRLEFEHSQYRIREGTRRTIRLFAMYPDLVSRETPVETISEDNGSVAVHGQPTLLPVPGSNYAVADVILEGGRLNAKVKIHAFINGRIASTMVQVVERDISSEPVRIDIRDEDFGNYRSRWADDEGEPNLLLISGRHKSLRRYLGPGPEFEGQSSPVFRLLLAEIVAESVCNKLLIIEAQENPWEFRLADLKDDRAIVDDVLARHHRGIRDFVTKAHSAMLSDAELRKNK